MPLETQLLKTIALLYKWQASEVNDLAAELLERRISIWRDALRVRAQEHGCAKAPNPPRKQDLTELKAMSNEDAKSIATTWNRDVEREIVRLFNANPRGNRNYYYSNLERWAAQRGAWKNLQIGLYTEQSTVHYANSRFYDMNGLRGSMRFLYSGPPPVSEECQRRFAAGLVTQEYVDKHPEPAHPNCPHTWTPTTRPQIPCDEIWVG